MIRVLTKRHENYIRKNYRTMSDVEIGKRLGGISKGTIKSFRGREGLNITQKMATKRRRSGLNKAYRERVLPEDKVIRKHYLTMPVKALAKKIGRSHSFVETRLKQLDLVIPREIIEQRKKDSQIQKGPTPPNKGKKLSDFMTPDAIARQARFKKGNVPHNTLYDGAITVRKYNKTGLRYKFIRLSKGKWEFLQKYNWEKEVAPIPKGMVLACKDGDTLNCDVSNWELITHAEHLRRHGVHSLPEELQEIVRLKGKITQQINKNSKRK